MANNNILVIEDDKEINHLLCQSLRSNGYLSKSAYTGIHGLEMLKNEEFEMVLLDIMLPYKSGDALLKELRTFSNIPVLVISAKETTQSKIDLLRLGADDYITKPFGIGELRARVAAHLRRETREKKHVVSVGGVQFYLKEKKVRYEGRELGFTKSEYAICEYLALNHGQVFSKDRIYEHVYGYEKESDNSVITEHIKNVRAKCQRAGFEPIETVWGIGYRWRKENVERKK